MILTKEMLGFFSVAVSAVGYTTYIISILKRRTKPHLFSWLIWGIVAGIVFAAQRIDHGGPGAWAMGYTALNCAAVALLALKYGEKKITRGDWLCLGGALLAIPVWLLAHHPLGAVIIATAIDGAAYYPTFRKSWLKPREENLVIYGVTVLRSALSLLALEHYSTVTMLSPLFIMIIESCFIAMVLARWRHLHKFAA